MKNENIFEADTKITHEGNKRPLKRWIRCFGVGTGHRTETMLLVLISQIHYC
jgi:hypothetical protein